MKVYVDRDEVIKLCEQFGVMALKKRIEELPVATIDDGVVIHAETATIACNIENLTL